MKREEERGDDRLNDGKNEETMFATEKGKRRKRGVRKRLIEP